MAISNPLSRCASQLLVAALVAVSLTSCAKEPVKPPVYPTSGSVLVKNKPAAKAVVVLRPTKPDAPANLLPRGEVGADGKFQLSTFVTADGAPAGEYAVTITWPETRTDAAGDEVTNDRLKGRYSDPAQSKWKITIAEGSNELAPFKID